MSPIPIEVYIPILSQGDVFALGKFSCLSTKFRLFVTNEGSLWRLFNEKHFGFVFSEFRDNRRYLISHLTLANNIKKLRKKTVKLKADQYFGEQHELCEVAIFRSYLVIPNKFGFTVFDRKTGDEKYSKLINQYEEVITNRLDQNVISTYSDTFPKTLLTIWDSESGSEIFEKEIYMKKACYKEEKLFFSTNENTFEVWDLFKGRRMFQFQVSSEVNKLCVHNDILILCCKGEGILGFDLKEGKICYKLPLKKSITPYVAHHTLLIHERNENCVKCFNLYTGKKERELSIGNWNPKGCVQNIVVYGKKIVAPANDDGDVFYVWDSQTGNLFQKIDFKSVLVDIMSEVMPFFPKEIYSCDKFLVFISHQLINGSDRDTRFVIWDLEENKFITADIFEGIFDFAGIDHNILCLASKSEFNFYLLSTGEHLMSYVQQNYGGVCFKEGVVVYCDFLDEDKKIVTYALLDFSYELSLCEDLSSKVLKSDL